ncbi:MAG TPA: polyribonucleotide nucleotidyltransferase [Candidatus Omnitrophica bacterium]|nr:polyribonucleotide nucleotidyltransferase [Candidatus Omnitrophota bacterium]
MNTQEVKLKIGKKELVITTGEMARQANGAVIVQYGGTVVLVTVVMSKEPKEDTDFFPLTVEYQERTYAAGKIPGGFFKREGRPTEKEILTARLTDRPVRPLFPQGLRNEVQIISIVLSSDGEHDPDVLSIIGASSALHISDIPFNGPVGAVKLGYINGEYILNPTYRQLEESVFNLVMAGTKAGVIMIETEAREVPEDIYLSALELGYRSLLPVIEIQEELRSKCGREKRKVELFELNPDLINVIKQQVLSKIQEINLLASKEERIEAMDIIHKQLCEKYQDTYSPEEIKQALYKIQKEEVRKYTLCNKKRVDGREFDELRPVTCKIGVLPRTHGSALFTRGQTQSLAVTTLGTPADEQMIEALEGEMFKKFMVHYNFPPFSVGEIKPLRGPGRREIGHGALAEKALKAVMPSEDAFPYTVRVVSDILESNGSSSMATVCGGSLSLMDAGVPVKTAVAGIAIGLFKEEKEEILLTDIAGLEDHYGDMDFKIAGTQNGITAVQLDLKIDGISLDLISRVLEMAKKARAKILGIMNSVIDKPRETISPYAPRITTLQLPPEKIALIIGPGGRTIRKLISETGAKFDIEEDGQVHISADDEKSLAKALSAVNEIIRDVEVGQIYEGKITRVANFGAFCEILPGKEGLIHISEISNKYVADIEDFVKVGDNVKVKVIGIDDLGRIQLSMKQLQQPQLQDEQKNRGKSVSSLRASSSRRRREYPRNFKKR